MDKIPYDDDSRIVLTLDAGGTTLKFAAIRGNALLFAPVVIPTEAHDLRRCLDKIVAGFRQVEARLSEPPVAISFAFPGPADYPAGIIGNLPNFPAFRAAGGTALGPMLEAEFQRPVYINNDGNLFVYGEAIAGFLPYANGLLEAAGNPKRYRNLFGLTLGTGLGGGVVVDGRLLIGDNAIGGEAHLLRNVLDPGTRRGGRRVHPGGAARLRGKREHPARRCSRAKDDCRHRCPAERRVTRKRLGRRTGGWARWRVTRSHRDLR